MGLAEVWHLGLSFSKLVSGVTWPRYVLPRHLHHVPGVLKGCRDCVSHDAHGTPTCPKWTTAQHLYLKLPC